MRFGHSVLLGLALAVSACGQAKRPDGGLGLLPVGSAAPDITAEDPAQHEVKLSSMRGKPVVVYFYPKDGTPGCTAEACAFRDAWKKYESANVGIIGVSQQSTARHRQFQVDEKLPFALASDEKGVIGASYGVKDGFIGYQRVSFLVDKEGKIAHVWPDVDPGTHADQVLSEAAALK